MRDDLVSVGRGSIDVECNALESGRRAMHYNSAAVWGSSLTAYLLVALGSALGGACRHAVNVGSARLLGTGWPYGTFTVNVVGSFAMGLIAGYLALRGQASQAWLLFLTTGILGGFTTFSAFSLDVALLFERGRLDLAVLYVVTSLALSVGGLFLGLAIVRWSA